MKKCYALFIAIFLLASCQTKTTSPLFTIQHYPCTHYAECDEYGDIIEYVEVPTMIVLNNDTITFKTKGKDAKEYCLTEITECGNQDDWKETNALYGQKITLFAKKFYFETYIAEDVLDKDNPPLCIGLIKANGTIGWFIASCDENGGLSNIKMYMNL